MGLEMGVMGLVALPQEQRRSLHQQRLWNGESDAAYSQGPIPSQSLLESQSLAIPTQWGSPNEPELSNPDVRDWKKQLLIGQLAFGKDLNGGGGGRQRGFLFLGFSWILLSFQTPSDSFVVSNCGSGIHPRRLHVASTRNSTCKEYGNQKRCGTAVLSQLCTCCKDVLGQGKTWIKTGKLLWSGRNEGHKLKSHIKVQFNQESASLMGVKNNI